MDEMNDTNEEAPPIAWQIRREGRAWTAEEFPARANRLLGVDLEISEGKLFWSDKARLLILGMLLEKPGHGCCRPARGPEPLEGGRRHGRTAAR